MRVVVGLGANLGDRLASIRFAIGQLRELGTIHAESRVYETEPVLLPGSAPQPRYYNAAVAMDTALTPDDFMRKLLAIETAMGRVRTEKMGPRTIDLDVLWIDGVTQSTETLVVPHPRLTERAFALAPLIEVAPDARDPKTNFLYSEISFDRHDLRSIASSASSS